MKYLEVTPDNLHELGIYCIRDKRNNGQQAKTLWYAQQYDAGMRMLVMQDTDEKLCGFIEFTPAEAAWRPVHAPGYLFIQCIGIFSKAHQGKSYGQKLLQKAIDYARYQGMKGICSFASDESWMADASLFEKSGFSACGTQARFTLLALPFDKTAALPTFCHTPDAATLKGWHLYYSNQCPWHLKAAIELNEVAQSKNIPLAVHKIESAAAARNVPGYAGTFALVGNGKVLADHYISKTRFENILRKELA